MDVGNKSTKSAKIPKVLNFVSRNKEYYHSFSATARTSILHAAQNDIFPGKVRIIYLITRYHSLEAIELIVRKEPIISNEFFIKFGSLECRFLSLNAANG